MKFLQEVQDLVDRWRARAEDCRSTGPVRADTLDACAAQFAEVLARAQGAPRTDPESIDLFDAEGTLRVA